MSDRSGAYIFGRVFELIAKDVPKARQAEVTAAFWKMSREYDFCEDDMHADEALEALGYMRMVEDPDWGDKIPEYGPPKKKRPAETGEG